MRNTRCPNCQTYLPTDAVPCGYCLRCVDEFRRQDLWCEKHGPTDSHGCLACGKEARNKETTT